MILELNEKEHELLARILERELLELRTEVRHTDAHKYRDELKVDESVLRDMIQRLNQRVSG